MKSTKYVPIDKNVIKEGIIYKFDIFTSSNSNTEMNCFKKNGLPITSTEQTAVEAEESLYILESDYSNYKHLLATLVDSKPKEEKVKHITFEERNSTIYENASKVLDKLFNNPEEVDNYNASIGVVNDMVETVSNDAFTIKSLISIAEHDYHTHTHSINVTIYTLSLGTFLNLNSEEMSELGEGALLHDIGKSKIDAEIVNKDGKLTDAEYKEIMKHPSLGYTIGLKLGIKNRKVLEGIRHHHEKMDGSGYPSKMRGENIPYYARIICICDIFDALTSKRSYKESMTSFEALMLMKTTMKTQIDTTLLKSMIQMFR